MRVVLLIVGLCAVSVLTAQNLVPNPGFENPDAPVEEQWVQPLGPYYHYNNRPGGAHTGVYFNGLCMYDYLSNPNEYLCVRLLDTLQPGQSYHLSFYLRLSGDKNTNAESMTELGIDFRSWFFDAEERQFVNYDPDAVINLEEIKSKYYWNYVETEFVADGSEFFMIVGNFNHNEDYNLATHALDSVVMANYDKLIKDGGYPGMEFLTEDQEKRVVKFLEKNAPDIWARYDSLDWQSRVFGYSLQYHFDDFCLSLIDSTGNWNCEEETVFEVGESVVIDNIFFENNSAQLLKTSIPALDELVMLLTNNPAMRVEIGGHTDNVGSSPYNLDLSASRAYSVMQYLINEGISPDRLSFAGYGEQAPIADNDSEEGRAANRRVEITILEK